MFKKIALFALSSVLVLSLAACGEKKTEEPPQSTPGVPTVAVETLTFKQESGAIIDIEASYPVVSMNDSAVADRINGQIQAYVNSLYGEYMTGTFTAAADSFYSKMQYEVTLCTADRLSIHIFALYCQSGPQYVYDHGFTFNLKTGELVKLTDLYTEDQIDRAIRGAFASLDPSKYPQMFEIYPLDEVAQHFLHWFSSNSTYAESTFAHDFYLSEDSLYLFAGSYKGYTDDVNAPYRGDGAFIIEIPFEKIPDAE
ncbi:MAG: hypothetical protein IJZ08_04420 [Clostridia bacterium]|nr:hypothetical protein [Clostridia bacterium]